MEPKLTCNFEMHLASIQRIAEWDSNAEYNLIIAASGYESRARHIVESFAPRRRTLDAGIVLGFSEHPTDCARTANDEVFRTLGYRSVICSGSSADDAGSVLTNELRRIAAGVGIKILIDISSMTRAWYGAMIRSLMLARIDAATVHFAYTPAKFVSPPPEYPPNRVVAPVPGFAGNTLPDKPTALVIGVGYDPDRARGLKDYLDPQLTVLFAANPSTDPRYVDCVREVNASLFQEVAKEHAFFYPVTDPIATLKLLESVCNGLRQDWRVVLCSLGPKMFGLCCFLLASIYRDYSIWRVTADHHARAVDHEPSGSPIIIETVWKAQPAPNEVLRSD